MQWLLTQLRLFVPHFNHSFLLAQKKLLHTIHLNCACFSVLCNTKNYHVQIDVAHYCCGQITSWHVAGGCISQHCFDNRCQKGETNGNWTVERKLVSVQVFGLHDTDSECFKQTFTHMKHLRYSIPVEHFFKVLAFVYTQDKQQKTFLLLLTDG